MVKASGITIRPPPGSRQTGAKALSICAASLTGTAMGSTANERATGSNGPSKNLPPPLRIKYDCDAHNAGRDLLEQFEPLPRYGRLEIGEASGVAAACNEAAANRIGYTHKYDRYCSRLSQERDTSRRRICNEHVGSQRDQFFREQLRLVGTPRCKPIVNSDVAAFYPTKLPKPLPEPREAGLCFWVILGVPDQHSDRRHLIGLLRACRERPRCRAAEKRYELAPSYAEHATFRPFPRHRICDFSHRPSTFEPQQCAMQWVRGIERASLGAHSLIDCEPIGISFSCSDDLLPTTPSRQGEKTTASEK